MSFFLDVEIGQRTFPIVCLTGYQKKQVGSRGLDHRDLVFVLDKDDFRNQHEKYTIL